LVHLAVKDRLMQFYRPSWTLFSLLLLGLHCHREPLETPPEELQILLKNFVDECSNRGIVFGDLASTISLRFGNLQAHGGSCRPNSHPKVITIDSVAWRILSSPAREMLVYHELAHCLLHRKHENGVLALGECKSWMRSGNTGCSINSVNYRWRDYYVNELFEGKRLLAPEWYELTSKPNVSETTKPVDGKIQKVKSNTLLFDSAYFNRQQNWIITIFLPPGNKANGGSGLRINEYSVGFATYSNTASPNVVRHNWWITLDQFARASPLNILLQDTSSKPIQQGMEVSVVRTMEIIAIYIEDELKVCIPISENGFSMSGYDSFLRSDASHFSVNTLSYNSR